MTPQKFTWRGQTWYFDPHIFWKEIFSGTHPHETYIIIILYSETRRRTVFFVIIYNGFVDSSKCDPHDFDPLVKNSSSTPGPAYIVGKYVF